MRITISGEAGSGKTTVGKILAKKLKYKFYSIGDLRGKLALEKRITIDKLNSLGEKEDWTDKKIDDSQKELGEKENNFIIDGRLSWYFIKDSINIFLNVNPSTSAKRIFKDQRKDEKEINNLKEMVEYLKQRKQSDIKRYKKYYKINPYELKHYKIVLDTSNESPEETANRIYPLLK
jgi:CMP/dCMP kinase